MMMTWNRVKVPCNFFDIIYLWRIEAFAGCATQKNVLIERRLRLRPGGKQSPDCALINATPAVWRLQPAQDADRVYAQRG